MAKNPSVASSGAQNLSINLERFLTRLNFLLVNPDADTEALLRTSKAERQKTAANIEYGRQMLVELEQDASSMRILSAKYDAQAKLVRQRDEINMLAERLRELNELAELVVEDDDDSEGEDILGIDTPEGTETETDDGHTPPGTASMTDFDDNSMGVSRPVSEEQLVSSKYREPTPEPEPQPQTATHVEASTLRHRKERAELFAPTASTSALENSKTTEQILSHNRAEQEELTGSMLSMAARLKQQSRAFQASLDMEKDVLDRAVSGLDKNELGLESAQRNMGFLRGYTEGKGWWGRMIMYVWIAGLMVAAILLVFVMPKLRF